MATGVETAPSPEPLPPPATEVVEAFRDWRPAPESAPVAHDDDEKLPDPVDLALTLLRGIAEEPFISGRFRAQARRYFRDLEKARARAMAGALADAAD
jgi:hypothetical protein